MSTFEPDTVCENPPYSTSPLLAQLDCVDHGFFGAQGGVSSGKYTSLNCGHSSLDDSARVSENRRRVASCFDLEEPRLHSLKQAHTSRVVQVDTGSKAQFDNTADGMVCNDSGIGLGSLGADCAPVLFVDPVNKVIGAAHSGWKGALAGVNEAVIIAMQKLGAQISHLHVAIGPAMQQQHYEVKADFQLHLQNRSPIDSSAYFCVRNGRLYFDTPGYIRARILAAGIQNIDLSGEDTYLDRRLYFSYRRSCKDGVKDYGRQIAVIALRA